MPPKKANIRAQAGSTKHQGKINSNVENIRELKINFSFRYLVWDSEKFYYTERVSPYFVALLERIQEISKMRLLDFIIQTNDTLRNHRIDFAAENVSEDSFGIQGSEEYDANAWQFSISSNAHGRVHGFFIDNTFYVVWLDPHHALYAGTK